MATLTSSSFSFREMLQAILPTVIGLCLFVPFFKTGGGAVDVTTIVLGGIVIGYLTSDMVREVSKWVFDSAVLRYWMSKYEKGWEQVRKKWRIGYLSSALLTKDETEVVERVGSNMIFTCVVSLYLLIYLAVNACCLYSGVAGREAHLTRWEAAAGARTPLVGGWWASPLVIIPVGALCLVFMLRDYLTKYRELFLPGGWYDEVAEKYHRKEGNVAFGVWGRVTRKVTEGAAEVDKPVAGLGVTLNPSGRQEKTDADGYFHFKDSFDACRSGGCVLKVAESYKLEEKEQTVAVESPASLAVALEHERAFPFVAITVKLTPKPEPAPEAEGSPAGAAGPKSGAGASSGGK